MSIAILGLAVDGAVALVTARRARHDPREFEAFYAIADQGWLVSEALEHALAALKRELAGQGITRAGDAPIRDS
jgi:hypothetical protein